MVADGEVTMDSKPKYEVIQEGGPRYHVVQEGELPPPAPFSLFDESDEERQRHRRRERTMRAAVLLGIAICTGVLVWWYEPAPRIDCLACLVREVLS